jgi:hypothetical protein
MKGFNFTGSVRPKFMLSFTGPLSLTAEDFCVYLKQFQVLFLFSHLAMFAVLLLVPFLPLYVKLALRIVVLTYTVKLAVKEVPAALE